MAVATVSEQGRERTTVRVSAAIRFWMAERRVNQTKLAEALGIPQSQISRRMHGKIAWSMDEIDCVARELGVDPRVLFLGLPHLDSNQEPAGYGSVRIIRLTKSSVLAVAA